MDYRNVALVLVVVGLACVVAPVYLGSAGGTSQGADRTAYVYAAEPVNLSADDDREQMIESYSGDLLLSVHEVSDQRSPDTYRAASETRPLLEFALRNDHATTEDPGVQADLRYIESEYTFVHDATDEESGYYDVFVRSNGTVVQMEPTSEDRVLEATLQETVVTYENLSRREQATFDRIREASNATDTRGHRPYEGSELLRRLPTVVLYEDVLYDVHRVGRVDDTPGGNGGNGGGLVDPFALRVLGGLLMAAGFSLFMAVERGQTD